MNYIVIILEDTMNILKNQTLYQCSYCGKRLLSRSGCKIHETQYCSNPKSPNIKRGLEKQAICPHENIETIWSYIPGEAVKEPDYDVCIDCNARL